MKITELLKKESIKLDGQKNTKNNIIRQMADLMEKGNNLSDKEQFIKDVIKREETSTTGIGDGIAIPHAKSSGVKRPGLSAMVVKEGTDYDALDGKMTNLIFNIAVPENSNDEHLTVLSRLSTILMDEDLRVKLVNSKTAEEFLSLIDASEREKFENEYNTVKNEERNGKYDVVAVTGCTTGIAHTYMAAEALAKKAEEMGLSIKVETNGASGVDNRLSSEDIRNAKGVIIASDRAVEMDRFEGKPLVSYRVAEAIHKPGDLINKIINNEAPVYTVSEKRNIEVKEDKTEESVGKKIYAALMNGVSHMLPFVIGGGILIAIAFLLDAGATNEMNFKTFGSNSPAAALFMKIGGTAFGFMLPVLAGFIAMAIADRPGLAVGFVGGMLANTGGAGFLGALVAGFLAGYLVLALRKITSGFPKSLDGIRPMLVYPVLGILLVGVIMNFGLIPPLAKLNAAFSAWLNGLGTTSAVILGLVLGGMMAVDMGGPVNKAAYVFGTASLAQGSSTIMAAVMAGGMVPPLGIAFAMIFFKNKFTARERQSIVSNIIMGLSFITEGAIPFAAADPLRVIPASIAGSALAGMLSMLFGNSLRAPHGGLWVIGVISNPVMYVVAILAGAILTMLLLGILKKDVE